MTTNTTFVPAQTNHALHLILTAFTCGAWAFVWLIVALYNHNRLVPVTTVTSPTYASGQWPQPGSQVSRMADGSLQWGYDRPAMWEVGHGEQHQVSPYVPRVEAQGIQQEESRDDLQRPA